MRVYKRAASTVLLTPPKSSAVVKVKAIERPTSPELLEQDLHASAAVASLVRKSETLSNLVVESADVVPGHVCVMEKCVSDAWTSHKIVGEHKLLQYLRFGIVACGTLAEYGIEVRDYKAANVGVRRTGSARSAYCIIDVAQLMSISEPELAVCTYPACGAYTYGTPGSLVGLAATAWSLIADMFAMCGHNCRRLSHETVMALPSSTPDYQYGDPVLADELLAWLETSDIVHDARSLVAVLTKMIVYHRKFFVARTAPKTREIAIDDAHAFYRASLDAIDEIIRHQHAAIM